MSEGSMMWCVVVFFFRWFSTLFSRLYINLVKMNEIIVNTEILNTAIWLAAPFKWAGDDGSVDGNGANGIDVDDGTTGADVLLLSDGGAFDAVFSGNGANGTIGSVAIVVSVNGANGTFGTTVVSGIGANGTFGIIDGWTSGFTGTGFIDGIGWAGTCGIGAGAFGITPWTGGCAGISVAVWRKFEKPNIKK